MIKRNVKGCQVELKIAEVGSKAAGTLKSAGNHPDLSSRGKKKIIKNIRSRSRRPSKALDKRPEVEEASPPLL